MLKLSPQFIGEPHWESLEVGDIPGALDQYLRIGADGSKQWVSSPFLASDSFVVRIESPNYRRPVTLRAKIGAAWTAKRKLFRRCVLRKAT